MNTVPEFLPILSHGSHNDPSQGACVMEMVSFLAGEEFSDQPECVAFAIRAEAIGINDLVSDDNRSQIALLIPRFLNTSDLNKNKDFHYEVGKSKYNFLKNHNLDSNLQVATAIKHAFTHDPIEKRRTNQEYDQIGIDWLNVLMDIADKHLGRTEVPSVDIYAETMKQHASQKANA